MADIALNDITNVGDTGIFDVLMNAVDSHINTQYLNNRITGSDYANVYLGSIQAVLQAAVQYNLQEQLTEAQIDGIAAENLLKAKQLEIAEQELVLKETEANRLKDLTEAELEKQWGYDVTRGIDDQLELGVSTGAGKIDKDIDVAERGMVEQELTGTAQRTILATEEQAKQYEVDNLLPEQLLKIQEEIDLLQTQDLNTLEQVKATYAERILKDKQAAKLGLDNAMKLSETARTSDPNYIYTPRYETV